MNPARVVGIVLVRNEERYLNQVVRNIADFCDKILLCDHASTDLTPEILDALTKEIPHAEVRRLGHPRESHELLKPLAGTNSWIFGVDGDEIYDPAGLSRLRRRILSGEFAKFWTVFGNVLNVTRFHPERLQVSGHLAPPCRSMTKLYNFAAIESWDGDCLERLHGGKPVFRPGYTAGDRRYLHEETSWDASDFRCLHLCFLPRSSAVASSARRNIMETYGRGPLRRFVSRFVDILGTDRASRWKNERYRRGPEVTVDLRPFFSEALLLP